ncbi:30S ribosomal protein S18 [Candidatus Kaiserbacteria bacterium]|nr:30S ribosomal protein S18 [Candidatus Kaiserbacteria bacterium]
MEKKENNIIEHFDYKDTDRIMANLNPHARIFNRRRTGLSAHGQRDLARAVKRARFMALVSYVSR